MEAASMTTPKNPASAGPPLAMSVAEFCKQHSISVGFFYALRKRGEGPRVMKVGLRTLISVEEAARWRARATLPAPAD
jgi:hypothetical protein